MKPQFRNSVVLVARALLASTQKAPLREPLYCCAVTLSFPGLALHCTALRFAPPLQQSSKAPALRSLPALPTLVRHRGGSCRPPLRFIRASCCASFALDCEGANEISAEAENPARCCVSTPFSSYVVSLIGDVHASFSLAPIAL